jgi:hypothetical protein
MRASISGAMLVKDYMTGQGFGNVSMGSRASWKAMKITVWGPAIQLEDREKVACDRITRIVQG